MDFLAEYSDHLVTLAREPHRYSNPDRDNLSENLDKYIELVKSLVYTRVPEQSAPTSRYQPGKERQTEYLKLTGTRRSGTGTVPYELHLLLELDKHHAASDKFLPELVELFTKFRHILDSYDDFVIAIKTMFCSVDSNLTTVGACSAGGVLFTTNGSSRTAYIITLGSVTTLVVDSDQTVKTRAHVPTHHYEQVALRRSRLEGPGAGVSVTGSVLRIDAPGKLVVQSLGVTRCLGAKCFKTPGGLGVSAVPVVLTMGVVGPTSLLITSSQALPDRIENVLVNAPDEAWQSLIRSGSESGLVLITV